MKTCSKLKALGLGAVLAAALTGCSSDSDSDGLVLPGTSSDIPNELKANYLFLNFYYFYAHEKNELSDNILSYYNAPILSSYGRSACTINYTDVCYMYSKMSDPYTRYYDPNYAAKVLAMINESDKDIGIGAILETIGEEGNTALVFTQVYEKSPAQKAGLLENDTLISIDKTIPATEKAALALLSGEEGDIISVEVKRAEDTLAFKIELGEFATPTVYLSYQDSIPVIRITEFDSKTVSDSGTYGEFIQALKKTEGAKSTIIDLRGNPGGDTRQCNSISAEFLDEGDTIIIDIETNMDSTIKNKQLSYFQAFDTIPYITTADGLAKDRYVVFLADTMSASCAEVVLSAVPVNTKSPIVGLISYGKGIGQYVIDNTPDNGLALITGLQSMDKNGNVYHRVGIVPDYESDDSAEQMKVAVEWAKERTKTRRTEGFYGSESTGHFAKKVRAVRTENSFPKNKKEFYQQLGGKLVIKK